MSQTSVFPQDPPPPPVHATPLDRWRWLLSGIIAILGGYITLQALTGGLGQVFLGFLAPTVVAIYVAQIVFGVAVSALGYFFVTAPLGRRILAKAVWVVGVGLVILFVALRLTTGFGGVPAGLTVANPHFMLLVFGGLGWLIASGVTPLRYLVLLVALVPVPINFLLVLGGADSALGTLVQLVITGIAAVVILLVSRPPVPKPIIGIAEQPQ